MSLTEADLVYIKENLEYVMEVLDGYADADGDSPNRAARAAALTEELLTLLKEKAKC